MKRLLLIIGILLPSLGFTQSLNDQKQSELLGRGHLNIGINGGASLQSASTGVTQYLAPRIQYFLKDGWSIALEGRHNVNGNFLRYTGIGLSSRYYFIRDKRLALFGQLGASVGQSKFSAEALDANVRYLPTTTPYTYERNKAWQATAGLGVHFRLSKYWSLEATGEQAWTEFNRTVSYRRWQGGMGVNFLLK